MSDVPKARLTKAQHAVRKAGLVREQKQNDELWERDVLNKDWRYNQNQGGLRGPDSATRQKLTKRRADLAVNLWFGDRLAHPGLTENAMIEEAEHEENKARNEAARLDEIANQLNQQQREGRGDVMTRMNRTRTKAEYFKQLEMRYTELVTTLLDDDKPLADIGNEFGKWGTWVR